VAYPDLSRTASDRFSIVSAFPATLVVLEVFALVQTGAFRGSPDLTKLLPKSKPLVTSTVLILALSVFVLALLLQPFQLGLVRLLEGYWGTSRAALVLSRIVSAPRRRQFSAHLDVSRKHLEEPDLSGRRVDEQLVAVRQFRKQQSRHARADAFRLRYPRTVDRVLPTGLGNALRSFEDTAGQRYGMETVPVFRRLHPLLSQPLMKSYSMHRLQLDSAAGLCVAFLTMTVVAVPPLIGDGWWQLTPILTLALAWMTYRGAITSALLMGGTVTTAFDLHRQDLIKALHYSPAADPALEYAFNIRLSRWLRGDDPDQPYAPQAMEDDYDHWPSLAQSNPVDSESAEAPD